MEMRRSDLHSYRPKLWCKTSYFIIGRVKVLIIIDIHNPYNYSVYFTSSLKLFTDPITKQIMICFCIVKSTFVLLHIFVCGKYSVSKCGVPSKNPRYLVLFSPSRIVTSVVRTSSVFFFFGFNEDKDGLLNFICPCVHYINVRGSIPIVLFLVFCTRLLRLETHFSSDHKHRSVRIWNWTCTALESSDP